MQAPCSVFITCETEEGYNRALMYNENVEMEDFKHFNTFLYQEIDIKEASEPSDILWENRHWTPLDRYVKKV